ncbi:MAG: hypothetical protein ACOC9S_04070, partial [Planctomycetota bacterium]
LILGIAATIPIVGIALGLTAIVLGIVSLVQKRYRTGMAVAGIVLGLVLPAVSTPIAMIPLLERRRAQARRDACLTNLSSLGKAMAAYGDQLDELSLPDLPAVQKEAQK